MYITGQMKCRICGNEHVAVIGDDNAEVEEINIDNTECPNCGNMSCELCECETT